MTILKISSAGLLAVTLGLSACTDTGDIRQPGNKERNGLIAGALVGAGLAGISNSSNKGAAVAGGAVAGALVGGLIGNQLDKQEAELRQNLSNSGITIVNTGDRLIVSLPNDLTFATDSAAISPAVQGDLRQVSQSLVKYPNSAVQVIGHTDSDGDATYNQALSERRANTVADQVQAGGVPYNRLQIFGRGEEQPVASNLTAEGKAQNRRVEIVIVPTSG
ncbi:OmpA family protein [Pseudophaeobacter flagellatus]|uniref:OmpA family protein n=1 Tax=Pseudophaeobacter flagellatus TaxID=2899119 RepID=UPI001E46A57E|nr:OmpA family protein [Pseudophaeobacter flagellatus]MCD9148027.1 OmpA family protein [Pseudophaeobacter flagellatus]